MHSRTTDFQSVEKSKPYFDGLEVRRTKCRSRNIRHMQNFFKSLFDFLQSLFRRAPRSLGARGEAAAVAFLEEQGYRILNRNYEIAGGELDIVALAADRTLVFVEVKSREDETLVRPEAAVDREKRAQLFRLGEAYVKRYHLYGEAVRYDIIAVVWPDGETTPVIRHWPAAFRME